MAIDMNNFTFSPSDKDGVGSGDDLWLWSFEENRPEIMLSIICTCCEYEGRVDEPNHRELCNRLAGGC